MYEFSNIHSIIRFPRFTGRNCAASCNNPGTTEAFIASGEAGPGYLTATEEWTAADFQIKTVTTS